MAILSKTPSVKDALVGVGTRIHALDVARALAIVGMMGSHLIPYSAPEVTVVHGYPSGLFAVLAGVSLALVSDPRSGARSERDIRLSVLTRGVLILLVGIALSSVQTLVAVVLSAIAMIYLLLGPVTRWRTRWIVALLAMLTLVAPIVANALTVLQNYSEWIAGPYPLHAWLAYGLVGILIHRYVLNAGARWWILCAVVGLGVGVWSVFLRAGDEAAYSMESMKDATMDHGDGGLEWLANYAHSGSVLDIFFTAMMALGVIAALLVVFGIGKGKSVVAGILYPLRAMGAMSLTVYTLHALSAQWLKGQTVEWQNLRTLVDPDAEISYGDDDSFVDGPSDMPWTTFQDRVGEISGWEEYWDFEANEVWGGGSVTDSSLADSLSSGLLGDSSWFPFVASVLGALVLCSVWKLFFVKGPAEAAVAGIVRRTCASESDNPHMLGVAGGGGSSVGLSRAEDVGAR